MIERYSRPEMARVWSEENRLRRFLDVELAALRVLARRRGVPRADVEAFAKAAGRLRPARVRARERSLAHETEAFIEEVLFLGRRQPRAARLFHFGLTSNDILDTGLALQAREAAALLDAGWVRVQAAAAALARRYERAAMAGRTHGMHAEPISFGFKAAGWHAEAARNRGRLRAAAQGLAFGKLSGPVGTYSESSPSVEAEALRGLGLRPEPAATQVIPRDRHAEFSCALALSAGAVERVATEIRHLARTEVAEAAEPFGRAQKGSSAMPHKRNPVLCENLCGLARLVRANAGAALESVALWHERDISHSAVERVALADACLLLDFMLARLAFVLEGLQVFPEAMERNLALTRGAVFSGRVLLALVEKGMERTRAYAVVQRCAFAALSSGRPLEQALRDDAEARRVLGEAGLRRCFDRAPFLRHIPRILRRCGIR